jgi:hypothetical protein
MRESYAGYLELITQGEGVYHAAFDYNNIPASVVHRRLLFSDGQRAEK